MNVNHTLLIFVLLAASCSGEESPAPTPEPGGDFLFTDGFETADGTRDELFPGDNSRWTNLQIDDPNGGRNRVELSSSTTLAGEGALRVWAAASDDALSKANIEKGGFRAAVGAEVRIDANFFLATTANVENLLLLDLECCSCWDPAVPDNQCPGVRLMMKDNDFLSIERGKILGTTLNQRTVAFPRNRWVNVVWELRLSPNDDGRNFLSIDGRTVIDQAGANMPNAAAFAAAFAAEGIDFNLQEPLFYERFQIGATANPTEVAVELFLDEVTLTVTQ